MKAAAGGLEKNHAETISLHARQAVIICSGGFYFNRNMVRQYAPRYLDGVALGTIGDDGSGIKLGQSVNADIGLMDSISAWRFINPPEAFVRGVLVNQQGKRICNEILYGAQLGERIMKLAAGRPG